MTADSGVSDTSTGAERFREVDRTSRRPARIELTETDDAFRVVIESDLRGKRFTRTITCGKTDPFIGICVEGFAARRLSVTCRFEMVDNEVTLEMDTVGGSIERPRERVHQPTFWPVPSLLTLQGAIRRSSRGIRDADRRVVSPRTMRSSGSWRAIR